MDQRKMARTVFLFAVLSAMFAADLFGQGGGNAAIRGTVTDPSGAVVAGAQVTVTQQSSSVKRSAATNASGNFTVPSLPPASYSVTIEAAGFKTVAQTVTLLADQLRDLDVRLEVGQSTQQASVEAAPVLVNPVTPAFEPGRATHRVTGI